MRRSCRVHISKNDYSALNDDVKALFNTKQFKIESEWLATEAYFESEKNALYNVTNERYTGSRRH